MTREFMGSHGGSREANLNQLRIGPIAILMSLGQHVKAIEFGSWQFISLLNVIRFQTEFIQHHIEFGS